MYIKFLPVIINFHKSTIKKMLSMVHAYKCILFNEHCHMVIELVLVEQCSKYFKNLSLTKHVLPPF